MDLNRVWWRMHVLLRVLARRLYGAPGAHGERGDVPGWVLVSVMTITVGMGLFAVARPMLTDMLRSALNSVR